MKPFKNIYHSHSLEETQAIAEAFASQVRAGMRIGLIGELGSGKTTFVQGFFLAIGGSPDVITSSPTFTLLHEYPTSIGPLYHFDLYRLDSYAELERLDFTDYLEGEGVSVIEWGDKWPELSARLDWAVRFEILGPEERKIEFVRGNVKR